MLTRRCNSAAPENKYASRGNKQNRIYRFGRFYCAWIWHWVKQTWETMALDWIVCNFEINRSYNRAEYILIKVIILWSFHTNYFFTFRRFMSIVRFRENRTVRRPEGGKKNPPSEVQKSQGLFARGFSKNWKLAESKLSKAWESSESKNSKISKVQT